MHNYAIPFTGADFLRSSHPTADDSAPTLRAVPQSEATRQSDERFEMAPPGARRADDFALARDSMYDPVWFNVLGRPSHPERPAAATRTVTAPHHPAASATAYSDAPSQVLAAGELLLVRQLIERPGAYDAYVFDLLAGLLLGDLADLRHSATGLPRCHLVWDQTQALADGTSTSSSHLFRAGTEGILPAITVRNAGSHYSATVQEWPGGPVKVIRAPSDGDCFFNVLHQINNSLRAADGVPVQPLDLARMRTEAAATFASRLSEMQQFVDREQLLRPFTERPLEKLRWSSQHRMKLCEALSAACDDIASGRQSPSACMPHGERNERLAAALVSVGEASATCEARDHALPASVRKAGQTARALAGLLDDPSAGSNQFGHSTASASAVFSSALRELLTHECIPEATFGACLAPWSMSCQSAEAPPAIAAGTKRPRDADDDAIALPPPRRPRRSRPEDSVVVAESGSVPLLAALHQKLARTAAERRVSFRSMQGLGQQIAIIQSLLKLFSKKAVAKWLNFPNKSLLR